MSVNFNAALNRHLFRSGGFRDNWIPNVPRVLLNASLRSAPLKGLTLFANLRHVGRQYVDQANSAEIEDYRLVDVGADYCWKGFELSLKINNLFDRLYATHGAEWGGVYLWPGATRNGFVSIAYRFE